MLVLFLGGLGLIVGSFLNVVILREESGESLKGRSRCIACRHELSALDLIPVLSWIALRGQCRYCHARISAQYPLVEFLTALAFVGVGSAPLTLLATILGLIIVSLCICIAVYDLRHALIPNRWNYAFGGSALLYSMLSAYDLASRMEVLFAGPLVAFPLFALWAISGGRWMGFGDVLFALGVGWLLGPILGYVALLGAFVLGALVSVVILLPLSAARSYAQKHGITLLKVGGTHFTMKSEVPFGPFLVAGCITVWLMSIYGTHVSLTII